MTRAFVASRVRRAARIVPAAALAVLLATAAAAQAPGGAGAPTVAAGEIVAFDGGKMTIALRDDTRLELTVAENARVTGLREVPFAELKSGDYIATAAFRQADGQLRAREVRIFPDERRGTAEGHFPYPGGEGSTMTNATIEAVVGDISSRTFKVTYKGGGEQTVVVPEDVPVMRMVDGDRSMLKPGAHVTVYARETPDGLVAVRFGVGLDGLKPPV